MKHNTGLTEQPMPTPDHPGPAPARPPRNPRTRRLLFTVAGCCLVCCMGLLPFAQRTTDDDPWMGSAVPLKHIGVAMHYYHAGHGRLPPAVVCDKAGRPLYSWRVLLLPYLEHNQLFNQFKRDEPWDSPHNRALAEQTPDCYWPWFYIRDEPPGLTHYQVFVGPGTAFEQPGLTWADFPDGLANTILVVDAGEPVPWSKPVDRAYDPNRPLPPLGSGFTKAVRFLGKPVRYKEGFTACFADVTTRFISSGTDEKTIRGLITRNGGEKVDASKLD